VDRHQGRRNGHLQAGRLQSELRRRACLSSGHGNHVERSGEGCSSSGTRWFWTRASFTFPSGLPKALQGGSAPQNPWVFSTVATAAQQTCAG
jgi:hypothetical protein